MGEFDSATADNSPLVAEFLFEGLAVENGERMEVLPIPRRG